VPISRCRVSYTDTCGVSHAVELDAESLYEAIALAVAEFRQDDLASDEPSAMTEFSVQVLRRPIEHKITLKRVQEWAQPSTKGGPAEMVKKERLRKMLTA
jgi:hypothetical protein